MALVLLGTEACHLCEQAQQLILTLQGRLSQAVYLEDIADSAEQVERYGMRIPVVLNEATQAELDWPFDVQELTLWLAQQQALIED